MAEIEPGREERARLAEALLASLEEEAEIERAWRGEIDRRHPKRRVLR